MNVLVTGGAGFLGGYIMAALQRQGHEAFAYDIAPPGADTLAVSPDIATRFRAGQINDIARLFAVCRAEKIEAIIHSAGMVGLEPSLEQPIATYQTNVMGLINVCEVARQLEMRRVVFVSSNAAYHKSSGAALVETDPGLFDPRRQSGRTLRHLQDGRRSHWARLCELSKISISSPCASPPFTASVCAARCTSSRWSRIRCLAGRHGLRPVEE